MSNELYAWFHDDITWCGNECHYIKCERNLANRLSKDELFSMAMFKNSELCPLNKENPATPTWQKGKAFCGMCGKLLQKNTNYCMYCGHAIRWSDGSE